MSSKKPAQLKFGPHKGYSTPKWFKKIKAGAHGNSSAQKKLWTVVSETYRKADCEEFGSFCPVCGLYFDSWKDSQLGHWLRYSTCNAWFKYERKNLMALCRGCNIKDDAVVLRRMGKELQRRYGKDVLTWIEMENQRHRGEKVEEWMCVDYSLTVCPALPQIYAPDK